MCTFGLFFLIVLVCYINAVPEHRTLEVNSKHKIQMPLSSTDSGRLSLHGLKSMLEVGADGANADDAKFKEFGKKLIAQMWADARLKVKQEQHEPLAPKGVVKDKIETGANQFSTNNNDLDNTPDCGDYSSESEVMSDLDNDSDTSNASGEDSESDGSENSDTMGE